MSALVSHRFDGLEPDNLLAFLALLGLLRSLEADDKNVAEEDRARPRAAWDVDDPPLRPRLFLSRQITREEVCERAARGLDVLAVAYDFGERKDIDFSLGECRSLFEEALRVAGRSARDGVDLLSALMYDGIRKDAKKDAVAPTPLCLQFGQGHQHFLERLSAVPKTRTAPRGKGRTAVTVSATQCLHEALFETWHRADPSLSFRWDSAEDVRYALMAGDPTDKDYKGGTQHGANRLAAVSIPILTVVPETRFGRSRANVIGGAYDAEGFSFAWPIWREPASLAAIRALLSHRDLREREPRALAHLGVDHTVVARRLSVGKYGNVARARPLTAAQ